GARETPAVRIVHLVGRSHRRGAELVAVELAEALDAFGHQSRLLAVGPGHEGGTEPGLEVLTASVRQRPTVLVRAAWRLRRNLRQQPADLILAHGGSAMQVAVVATADGGPPSIYQLILAMPVRERGFVWRAWWRLVLARTAGAVALTEELSDEVREMGLRGPVWLIPNARRPERFAELDREQCAGELRAELGIDDETALIGFVGHLVPQKRPDLAIDVLGRVLDRGCRAHLVVVGGGPLADAVAQRVSDLDLGDHVSALGHRPDVEVVLGAIDLLVLPSDDEGMPGVAIEAQMAGCPVVSFPVGGASEVLEDGHTGIVLRSHDVDLMAAEVVGLLADGPRLRAMGAAARIRSERFTMASAAAAYDAAFRRLVDGTVMAMERQSHQPEEVSLRIVATPEAIYSLLSDVTRMGQLSPECTGGRWLGGATGPAVGARFKGTNKRGLARWSTTNTVVVAEPGREFVFDTKQSGARWRYHLVPDGDGTVVAESREDRHPKSMLAKAFTAVALGGSASHQAELRRGMVSTLERLRDVAEAKH
ncbi:MAG: glycosyltransferase, partial [Aquihabitans sp.]